jgi:anti-sigma B factor antagonist
MALRLTVDPGADGGAARLAIAGEVDLSSAPELERSLSALQASGRPVVVDMRDVSFMDSSGLRMILAADTRAQSSGSRLPLVPGPPGVQRVFQLALLDRRLEFVDDPEQAPA